MKLIKGILKISLIIFLLLISLITAWWFWPEGTPKIDTIDKNSVATIDYIKIGGIEQCVLIRSKNVNNPVLLFLHGGPGMPMMYLAHEFQRPLEENFTVVQWDRRGAGKTYARNIPSVESINLRQILDDAYELIDTLRNRFNKNKVILVGHSFGTHLGSIMATERPDLFNTYISIGQVVDDEKTRVLQEKFIYDKASLEGRVEILEELKKPFKPDFESLLFEFGGEIKNSKSFLPLIWTGILAPEYSLSEVLKVGEASSFSSSNMKYNVLDNSIYYAIREYQVPVYFFVGKFDYTTPFKLIEDYYDMIEAPDKRIIYFDNSAHFPFFEEPEKFCDEINKIFMENSGRDKL